MVESGRKQKQLNREKEEDKGRREMPIRKKNGEEGRGKCDTRVKTKMDRGETEKRKAAKQTGEKELKKIYEKTDRTHKSRREGKEQKNTRRKKKLTERIKNQNGRKEVKKKMDEKPKRNNKHRMDGMTCVLITLIRKKNSEKTQRRNKASSGKIKVSRRKKISLRFILAEKVIVFHPTFTT